MDIVSGLNSKLNDIANSSENKNNKSLLDIINEKTDGALQTLSGKGVGKTVSIPDNIIAFTSASGGSGSTTIVANVAYKLRKMGKTVLVVDANIMNPALSNYLGYKVSKEKVDLLSYLTGEVALGDAISNNNGGVALLSSKNRTLSDFVKIDNGVIAKAIDTTILRLRQLFDVVIFDIPTNFIASEIINTILYKCDMVYTVWSECVDCINNTERLKINMSLSGISHENKLKKIILNQRTNIFYSEKPLEKLGLELISVIPFELGVRESGLRKEIFIEKGLASSRYAKAYCEEISKLAEMILADCSKIDADMSSVVIENSKELMTDKAVKGTEDDDEFLNDDYMDELTREDD